MLHDDNFSAQASQSQTQVVSSIVKLPTCTSKDQNSTPPTQIVEPVLRFMPAKTDTGYPLQWQAVSNSTSHQGIHLMQTYKMINCKMKKNKIPWNKTFLYTTQMYLMMYLMMTMIVQLLTLLLMPPKFSWKSQSQNFSQLTTSQYQMKR